MSTKSSRIYKSHYDPNDRSLGRAAISHSNPAKISEKLRKTIIRNPKSKFLDSVRCKVPIGRFWWGRAHFGVQNRNSSPFMGPWRAQSRSKGVLIDFYGFLHLLGTFPENLVQIGPSSNFGSTQAHMGQPQGPKI